MVLKNNVIDVLNNRIRATNAIAKCSSYLLSSKLRQVYGIGLLDLKAYAPNLGT